MVGPLEFVVDRFQSTAQNSARFLVQPGNLAESGLLSWSRLSANLRKSLHTGVSSEFCTGIKLTDYMDLRAEAAQAIGAEIALSPLITVGI